MTTEKLVNGETLSEENAKPAFVEAADKAAIIAERMAALDRMMRQPVVDLNKSTSAPIKRDSTGERALGW